MENVQAVSLIIGIAMPLLVTIVKQIGLRREWNLAIAIVTCIAAAVLQTWAQGALTTANLLVAVATVFAASQAIYQAFWNGTKSEEWLDKKTSVIK